MKKAFVGKTLQMSLRMLNDKWGSGVRRSMQVLGWFQFCCRQFSFWHKSSKHYVNKIIWRQQIIVEIMPTAA